MKVLLTGASGLLGTQVGKELTLRGHQVVVLTRSANAKVFPFPCHVIQHDLNESACTSQLLYELQGVIHLAGENVGEGNWTPEKRRKIAHSRINATKNLLASLTKSPNLTCIVMASAVGFYGHREDEELAEDRPAGQGFLSEVGESWEKQLFCSQYIPSDDQIKQIRKVALRLGVVLSPFGGMLDKLIPIFREGLGAPMGNGKQWMSWIHVRDAVNIFCNALENSRFEGIYNAVAGSGVTNREFSQKLAEQFNRRLLPGIPAFLLRFALGAKSALVLDSTKASGTKVKDIYEFHFDNLEKALENCCELHRNMHGLIFKEQYFDAPKEKVFPFFALAENLEEITPPSLNFKIIQKSSSQIGAGTRIDYKLKLHGIPLRWQTLISQWQVNNSFTDEQLKGPYKIWKHQHHFQALDKGTLMTDIVQYRLPAGRLGVLLGGAFVKYDVQKIFRFRFKILAERKF